MPDRFLPANLAGHAVAILLLGLCGLLGAMCLASAVETLFTGPFDSGQFVVAVIAGTAFGGMGLGGLYFLYGHAFVSSWWQRRQFERYAEEPWMRKKAWRTGKIPYRKPAPTAFLWIFSLGWNAMLGTVLWGNRDMIGETVRENWLTVFPLGLFVLIGLGVLAGAIGSTFTRRIANRADFVMASVPAWTGGNLEGVIQTRIPFVLKDAVALELASSVGEPIRIGVPADRLAQGLKGLEIPVVMAIPAESAPTDEFDPERKVRWTLEARMKLPREELTANFPVPVYRKPGDA